MRHLRVLSTIAFLTILAVSLISCGSSSGGGGNNNEKSPAVFTDNHDGTVTDKRTGLIWQKAEDPSTYNWYEASGTYDAVFNSGLANICGSLELAGQNDWRLPTKKELMYIADYGTYDPSINATYFPNTSSDSYWSSSVYAGDGASAWGVDFFLGNVYVPTKSIANYVRCVRGSASPAPGFTDGGNGTITDDITGLMWQAEDDNVQRTWAQASTYCGGLSFAGHSDWRLPDIKELESITKDDTYNPAINNSVFLNTAPAPYWSATSTANNALNAWGVDFYMGNVDNGYTKTDNYYVRCVR